MTVDEFIRMIAELTPDGECRNPDHETPDGGLRCDGNEDDCELFIMENDDAVSTLGGLIDQARLLRRGGA